MDASTPPVPLPLRTHPWDGFLVGPENELAHASALALARGDGVGLSPLVVHGPSGAGKSRLLKGLVTERLLRRPESAVAHWMAEAFAAACAEAIGKPGGWSDLRQQFRALDLFVLEDLEALERAPLAQSEFSHTLDALDEAGAFVAVSARMGPGQWSGWPVRLVNRLIGGLAVRIDPPGLVSRRRYLLEQTRMKGLNVSAGAIEALAMAADGYRTLDGWLASLALSSRVERQTINSDLVARLIAGDPLTSNPTIDRVARDVASAFGVRLRDLRSSSRRQTVVEPRHLAIHQAREVTGLSFQAIGNYFGNRDPATVRHSCQTAAARLAADPASAAVIAGLRRGWGLIAVRSVDES